ncbi:MAG: hypothetical protein L3J34_03265 [Flavobacteriaceae bacterium]|nr:hypothetical protein [Flavobacteriaceae bacterium]
MGLNKYFAELKRRQVIKVGIAYLVSAWLIIQVLSIILPTFDAPLYILKTILVILGIGFPLSLIIAWVYEITPSGIKKTKTIDPETPKSLQKGRKLNKVIIITLSLAIVVLLYNQFIGTDDSQLSNTQMGVQPNSLAVLAFEDISKEKDQEYFSDGMSTELISLLSKMKDLFVIDRRSSFTYKGTNANIKSIGKELQVNYIIDGSVRKNRNEVRIDIQLIDASNGETVWTQTFNRKLDDIFKMQNDISLKVREQLKLHLFKEYSKPSIVNPKAYSLYLQADFLFFKNNVEFMEDVIKNLEESIAMDSTFAPAYALLSRAIFASAINYQKTPLIKGLKDSRKAAEKAILLDGNNGNAYAALARLDLQQNMDFNSANYNIDKALKINPNNAYILANAAIVKGFSGITNNLVDLVNDHNKLLKLNPKEYGYYRNKGIVQIWLEDFDGALQSVDTYLHFYPSAPYGNFLLAKIYVAKKEYQNALDAAKKEPLEHINYFAQSIALYGLGRRAESDQLLEKFISSNDENAKALIAEIYAYRGDKEKVLKYLNLAYTVSDPDLIEAINWSIFKLIYDEPRWKELLVKMNLPKSHRLIKYLEK